MAHAFRGLAILCKGHRQVLLGSRPRGQVLSDATDHPVLDPESGEQTREGASEAAHRSAPATAPDKK